MKEFKHLTDYETICRMIIEGEAIPFETVQSKSRKRELVFVRQLCMYMGLEKTNVSQAQIGKFFGKDHATAIHARKTINNLIDTERDVRAKVERYKKQISEVLTGLSRFEKSEMVKFWIRHKVPFFVREQKLLSFGKRCPI